MILEPRPSPRFSLDPPASEAGSERDREELVRRHAGALLEFACRLLGDARAAVEATQAAFLAALQEPEESSFARDELRDLKRRLVERARGRLAGDPGSRAIEAMLPTFDATGRRLGAPAREWMEEDDETLRRSTRRCIDEVPEPYRAVLFLCDVEGLPVEDCAAWLGLSAEDVRDARHRARQALLGLLEGSVAVSGGSR